VASDLFLGKHQLAVNRHVEDAAGGLDQLDLDAGNLPAKLRRQTGGAGLVVSNDAVCDADLHRDLIRLGAFGPGILDRKSVV